MEHDNFSYAKRTKIFGMLIFLVLNVIIFMNFISAAPIVWGQQLTYDNYQTANPPKPFNTTLWTEYSTGVGICAGQTFDSNIYACVSNSPSGYGSDSIVTNILPDYLYLDNLSVRVQRTINLDANGNVGINYFSLFGTEVFSYPPGSVGPLSYSTDNTYNLKRNGTNFDLYNGSTYAMTITPINSIFVIQTACTASFSGSCSSGVTLYKINYTYGNTAMDINLVDPQNNEVDYSLFNVSFNINIHTAINSFQNISLYFDGLFNESQTITGTTNSTSFEKSSLAVGNHTWYVKACDTATNCKNSETRTLVINPFNVVSETYNNNTYETASETFQLVTSSINDFASAQLNYNGVNYVGSYDNTTSPGQNIFSVTLDVPVTNGVSSKNFYWILTTLSSDIFQTATHIQTVNPITFSICNATNTVPYINYTYKDEMAFFNINASVPNANFNYWLGGGSVFKNYFYSTGVENPSSGFCFTPSDKPISLNYIYKATSLGSNGTSNYPTRTFNSIVNLTLSNGSRSEVLYLIQSAESGTVIIQVIDISSGNSIQGARVTITRDIGGTPTVIADGYTDAAGSMAVFLSSVISYTITVSKPNCGAANTQTITPVGSYTMSLNCAGNITQYVSTIDGVTYQHTPDVGISLIPGNTTFAYYVSSSFYPITAARFQLWDNEGGILASNTSYTGTSFCNTTSCMLTIKYYSACGDNIKGRYYVNLGNQSNNTFILLEKDAYWRYICINSNNSQQAWKRTVLNFNEFMNIWTGGAQQTNCIIYKTQGECTSNLVCKWQNTTTWDPATFPFEKSGGICMLRDDINKMEFNRILMIFFGMVVVLFIMGRGIGYEMTNPGSFVLILSIIIVILSIGGMFTFSGLTPWDWFNQYIYAYICITLAAGYNFSIIRRYSA